MPTDRSLFITLRVKGNGTMVVFGVDAHKRSHTVVAVDEVGRKVGEKTINKTTSAAHLGLLCWAETLSDERVWAIEDCRAVSRRLEGDLVTAGEQVRRVPPHLMGKERKTVRTPGKSDPIDALAVGRVALQEPDLPTARLDESTRHLRLLVDHRDDLVAERTRHINRLRWHLHELDPTFDPPSLTRYVHLDATAELVAGHQGTVATIAAEIVEWVRDLTRRVNELGAEIEPLVADVAPSLLDLVGVGGLTAAKIVCETADVRRFKSKDAYARHNGTAPEPSWSGHPGRHRLSRRGNRQLNAAIYRIAITQARWHPDAIAYLDRRRSRGDTKAEARRALKRKLSNVIYRTLLADAPAINQPLQHAA